MVEYQKSAVVLVFNDNGELALQLRASNDSSFPTHWHFSAGGGIDPGEDSKLAIERELREELGIDANVEFITEEHYTYPAWNPAVTREVDLFIYKCRHNGHFNPDQTEVERVEFFKLETIKKMIESGVKFHPEFTLSWNKGIISQAAIN